MSNDIYLDAKGWLCPKPIIEARRILQKIAPGKRLHVVLTDPHGPLDFEVFCQRSGHQLLECKQNTSNMTSTWQIIIEKHV